MPYPPDYTRSYSFTAFAQAQGDNSYPGDPTDNEFDNVAQSLDDLNAFIEASFDPNGILKPGKTADTADFSAAIAAAEAQALLATTAAGQAQVSATAAAGSASSAAASAAAAASSAAILPSITAQQFLIGNVAGNAWITISATDARALLQAQPLDADLTAIAALASAADKAPYATAAQTWALYTLTAQARTFAAAVDTPAQRTALGLGTMATQASSAVSISGGAITGITDLAIADGGTASSTAAGALTNLGALPVAGGNMTGALTLNSQVALTAGALNPVSNFYAAGAITPLVQTLATGQAGVLAARYSANANPPTLSMAKSRGTSVGQHVVCATSDQVGAVTYGASNGTKFTECARIVAFLTATPSTDYSATEMRHYVSSGSGETLVLDLDGTTGDIRAGGSTSASNVVTGARHIQLRSYTVATLPSASTAGMEIYVSDAVGGLRHAVSDGTVWRLENGQDAAQLAANAQTGTAYTLALIDMYRLVEMNNASANTLTIPLNATVAFPVGTVIDVLQTGAGKTTVAGAVGTTVNSTAALLSVAAQWSTVRLRKRATDTWVVTGSLIA